MDSDRLAELDAEGYTALLAIAYGRGPKHGSFAYPHAFVCEDGETYLAAVDAGLRCECPEPDLAGYGYRDHAPICRHCHRPARETPQSRDSAV